MKGSSSLGFIVKKNQTTSNVQGRSVEGKVNKHGACLQHVTS